MAKRSAEATATDAEAAPEPAKTDVQDKPKAARGSKMDDDARELSAIRAIKGRLKELPPGGRRRVLDFVENSLTQDLIAEREAAAKVDLERYQVRQGQGGLDRDTPANYHVGGFVSHRV